MTTLRTADGFGLHGRVQFTVWDHDYQHVTRRQSVDNLVVNVWLNQMRNGPLTGADQTIRYLAWGTSSTAPAAGNTALVAESGRKAVTLKTAGTTGVAVVTTYVAPGEANANLQEWGLFGGPDDALVLVSRVLWSHTKTASESIQIDWTLTWSVV